MTLDTFDRALGLTRRLEIRAHRLGYRLVLLSGGECTEHPDIVEMVQRVVDSGFVPVLVTNGAWLDDEPLRKALLRPEWPQLSIQVTNDPRFYPRGVPRHDDPRIVYVDSLTVMIPLGRFAKKKPPPGMRPRLGPPSFNLRSLTRSLGDVCQALAMQRGRALVGLSGHCSPSISSDGTLVAGETRMCFPIGTVDSSAEEVTRAILSMGSCNRCTLEDRLSQEAKRAIGISRLYVPGEVRV